MSRTPLHAAHLAAGARLVDFAGLEMPLHYGSQIDEHHAVRGDAGVFDVSHMMALDIEGEGARAFLRRVLGNDVARLARPGTALYSCLLAEDGGILDDLIAYWLDGARFRLVLNAATQQGGRQKYPRCQLLELPCQGRAGCGLPHLKGHLRARRGRGPRDQVSMDHCILEAKDIFRSLDYLETRSDIRKDRIGYLGFSWGAAAGPFVCAVEKRIKVAVLLGGGLEVPEMLGFSRRCLTPTQMVNGRFDGYDENQAPLFRSLGAPADKKRLVVFDADHTLSGYEKEVMKANLEWFDRFLGPVR